MVFEQYYLGCLSHASYLIADPVTGRAVVVDPQRDVDGYLADAEAEGLRIEQVLLTHFHADFVAGHLELRERVGARIRLGPRARADFEFEPFGEGDVLDLGGVRLTALETPGHTPEGISVLVWERPDSPEPTAVLTGDTLFVGDVGRPDLMASVGVTAAELAGQLYASLHDKLLALPDATQVYPAHGAGSMCGKNLSSETVSTIGEQRRTNYALQPMSREQFVGMVTADQPPAPAYFPYDAQMNRSEHATLASTLPGSLTPLDLAAALRLRDSGAQLVDTRDADVYAAGHVEGSVNVGLGGRYASWVGTLLHRERPIVVVVEPGREREAVTRLGRIGFDGVAGYLPAPAGRELRRHERIDGAELARRLEGDIPPLVLDVRDPGELEVGRIDGSLHVPLVELSERLDELPRDRPIAVHCASGYRSSIAIGLLERDGRRDLVDLAGGWAGWSAAVETSA